MDNKTHWETIYQKKAPDNVSWFQKHAETSLQLIKQHLSDKASHIIDIGAGTSTLVDDLLAAGYQNIDLLDISREALDVTRQRLAEKQHQINWHIANLLDADLPSHQYDLWHDRAVFHFLTDKKDRNTYVQNLSKALKPGGHVVISTFGPEGPLTCSGLPIVRYDHQSLHGEFGAAFKLLEHRHEDHLTPNGSIQKFIYCYCRMANN